MRIKLKKSVQHKMIRMVKEKYSWKKLSEMLELSKDYIRNSLYKEKTLISNNTYNKLKNLTDDEEWDQFIIKKLPDNWGKSKGGKNSKKFIKPFRPIRESTKLAELFGIILGDGHIEYIKGNNYSLRIVGHIEHDYDFLSSFVSNLIKDLFKEEIHVQRSEKYHSLWITIYGKKMVEFIIKMGLKSGNKKENNVGIPNWIKNNKTYLKNCVRGLIDTDGSVHLISKDRRGIRINFTNNSGKLLTDVKESLEILGFSCSKIIRNKQIFITKKEDVERYIKEVGFNNKKHLNRILKLQAQAPVV